MYTSWLRFLRFLVLLAFVFILESTSLSSLHAQSNTTDTTPSTCRGLDVVLLIDQSNSMGDNDPDEFRLASVYTILDQLGYNRMFLCEEVFHRIAVISFGDASDENPATEVDLSFTTIEPDSDPASADAWKGTREALKERIKPRELGNTDFASAFAEAKRLFDGLGAPDSTRTRAIFLLTDGGPCVQSLGCSASGNNSFAPGSYLNNMRSDIGRDFPFTDPSGTYIFVVALHANGPAYMDQLIGRPLTQSLRDYWRGIAESHGGELITLSRNAQDIPAEFFDRLNSSLIKANTEEIECGVNIIEPYTARVLFTFFKNIPSNGIVIGFTAPDQRNVQISNGKATPADAVTIREYNPDTNIERYVIDRPAPGSWTITSNDCSGARMFREPFVVDIQPTSPSGDVPLYDAGDSSFDPDEPFYLEYKLLESGLPFPENPIYPLTLIAQVKG